jgi:hypothetical protein
MLTTTKTERWKEGPFPSRQFALGFIAGMHLVSMHLDEWDHDTPYTSPKAKPVTFDGGKTYCVWVRMAVEEDEE